MGGWLYETIHTFGQIKYILTNCSVGIDTGFYNSYINIIGTRGELGGANIQPPRQERVVFLKQANIGETGEEGVIQGVSNGVSGHALQSGRGKGRG